MAVVNTYQRDVLHSLGYGDDAISGMGQALVSSIIAEYNTTGTAARAAVDQSATSSEAVFWDTLQSGVGTDLTDIGLALSEATRNVGQVASGALQTAATVAEGAPAAIRKLIDEAPLLLVAAGLLAVFFAFGRR